MSQSVFNSGQGGLSGVEFRFRTVDLFRAHLKWLDETGSQLNLTRSYERALLGQQVVETDSSGYDSNDSLLAVLGLHALPSPW